MKPNVEQVGMARLAASLLVLSLAVAPAFAGDRAGLSVIGYSDDSRFFAFEEFGIQDGSGFAYSTIYLIDLDADAWVAGTPIRVQAEGEGEALPAVRAEALVEASGKITELGITTPADMIALNGDGVPDNEAQSLRFGVPGYLPGSVIGRYDLTLSSFFAEAEAPCEEWFSIEPQGFSIELTEGDTSLVWQSDGALPRSRGCPSSYRLYGVTIPFMAQSIDNAVALISVYPGGFEGPDRRFLAVPLGN
jgi:predicted secreted protein